MYFSILLKLLFIFLLSSCGTHRVYVKKDPIVGFINVLAYEYKVSDLKEFGMDITTVSLNTNFDYKDHHIQIIDQIEEKINFEIHFQGETKALSEKIERETSLVINQKSKSLDIVYSGDADCNSYTENFNHTITQKVREGVCLYKLIIKKPTNINVNLKKKTL